MLDIIETTATDNPYPGLRSFRRDETHIFFGRENTVGDMVDRMAIHRFLAVTGYSGSGKSSLVRVGLLDALDRGMLVDAGSRWAIVDFAPGGEPFSRLTSGLSKALESDVPEHELRLLEAKLARGPNGLVALLDEVDFPQDVNLLLLVDQFEEIFRYRQGRVGDDVDAFVQLLLASAKQRDRSIYVVITMRSDFLGDCARFSGLAEQINDAQFLTPRLTREQCREAIEGPAGVFGGRVQAELVTRMLNDMAGNPDQLPLMQHLLMLLWELARDRTLSGHLTLLLHDYERLGGIGHIEWSAYGQQVSKDARNGALSDHADRILSSLSSAQQSIAANLFKALTESQGAEKRAIRRPVSLEEAAAIVGVRFSALIPIVEAFRAPNVNFLTPARPIRLTPETIVDITHESLIRQWGKLRDWVSEEHQSAETYRSIERSAKQWHNGLGNLLSKLDLAVARKWQRSVRPNVSWAGRYGDAFDLAITYLQRSISLSRKRRFLSVSILAMLPALPLAAMTLLVAVLKTGLPYVNPADEWSSFGVEPQSTLTDRGGGETPVAIPGGTVIGTAELELAIKRGTLDGSPFLPIDVAYREGNPKVEQEIGAHYHINFAGARGTFKDEYQQQLEVKLAELTNGNLNMPLVFFCAGATCWNSYNASLRAINLHYTRVYWYRGGLGAWRAVQKPFYFDFKQIPLEARDIFQSGASLVTALAQEVWPSAGYSFQSGKNYFDRQRYDKAIDEFTQAITRDPAAPEYRYWRGRGYLAKTEYKKALVDFDKFVEMNAVDMNVLYYRGISRRRLNDFEGAIADFAKALEANPNFPDARSRLAEAYERRGEVRLDASNFEGALADYTKAIELEPGNATYNVQRGNLWRGLGDRERALQDYAAAIALDNERSFPYYSRAVLYSMAGTYTLAMADFTKAIELDPKNIEYLVGRGLTQFYRGEFEQAVVDFSRAIRIDGRYGARRYLALFLYLARARARSGGTAAIELQSDAAQVGLKETWPFPVLELFTGARKPSATLQKAESPDQICEARFYIGQWHLLQGNKDAAILEMKAASHDSCRNIDWEYRAAIADIKRLGGMQ